LLEKNKTCKVYAIDRDPNVKENARFFQKKYNKRFKFILGKISDLEKIASHENLKNKVSGILFDLGVSTRQLKDIKRGFSFQNDGPLDMRMGESGKTAEEFLNSQNEKKISDVIFEYGEERFSRKIAKAIINYKKKKRIERTLELVEIVKSVKKPSKNRFINPATKTFQAIRIYVNNEIEELKGGLISAINILKKKGRLAVISFHSLEDRIVKDFFNKHSGKIYNKSRYLPQQEPNNIIRESLKIITKKVIKPMKEEIELNYYSRSAKLRVAEKI
jgi:16S rRNA (cytosine1402-N4)-methyltransferase